jgi:hypothetical protein
MHDASLLEVKQLVLAAPLDARDVCAGECAAHLRTHATTQRRMEKRQPGDFAAKRTTTQLVDGGLDFRQLGHA